MPWKKFDIFQYLEDQAKPLAIDHAQPWSIENEDEKGLCHR